MFALPAEKKWQIYCSKKKVSPALTWSCTAFDLKITYSIYCTVVEFICLTLLVNRSFILLLFEKSAWKVELKYLLSPGFKLTWICLISLFSHIHCDLKMAENLKYLLIFNLFGNPLFISTFRWSTFSWAILQNLNLYQVL